MKSVCEIRIIPLTCSAGESMMHGDSRGEAMVSVQAERVEEFASICFSLLN